MSPAAPDFVDLAFRPDLNLLFGRWLRAATDAEVRQGYEAALSVALPYQARYWLLDMRRRGPVSQAATRWVVEAFLPRLVECMREQLHLAYLLSPSHLHEAPPQAPTPGTAAPCHIRLFTDECSALHWLADCRRGDEAGRPPVAPVNERAGPGNAPHPAAY
jgi:hypothetical protein